jgi:hypothetical protein
MAKFKREGYWTESVAVGGLHFVKEIKARLGIEGMGRRIEKQAEDRFVVKEAAGAYSSVFELENGLLSQESSYYLDDLDL